MRTRLSAWAIAAALLLAATSTAHADGEAGLVIDYGNGQVDTFCIPFSGDGIVGADLLQRAGAEINHFSGLVCSVNDVGCRHSGSFDSCTCECKSTGGGCTYWTFFQKRYGAAWVYSSIGFQGQQARDGDVQAWKWQSGSPSNAPVPGDVSFESICGHPPVSIAPPTATATSTVTLLPPTSTPTVQVTITQAAATATSAGTMPITTQEPGASPSATTTEPATNTAEASASASASASSSASSSSSPAASVAPPASGNTSPQANATDAPKRTASDDGESGGGGAATLISFGALVAVLGAGIGGAVWWRRSHG